MSLSAYAWVAVIVGLLIVEGIQLARGKELLTDVVRKTSPRFLLVPFLAGMLAGHFFWCGCP